MTKVNEKTGLRGFYTLSIKRPDGSPKPVFQYNRLGFWLLKKFGFSVDIPYITGNWANEFKTPNTIVDTGLAEITNLAGSVATPAAFTYLALGSGSTAVATTDTSLVTELTADGLSRASATVSRVTTNVADDTLQLTNTFTYSGSTATTVEELGIFNDATAGDMLSRSLTGGKTVDTNGETIDVTYKLIADRV